MYVCTTYSCCKFHNNIKLLVIKNFFLIYDLSKKVCAKIFLVSSDIDVVSIFLLSMIKWCGFRLKIYMRLEYGKHYLNCTKNCYISLNKYVKNIVWMKCFGSKLIHQTTVVGRFYFVGVRTRMTLFTSCFKLMNDFELWGNISKYQGIWYFWKFYPFLDIIWYHWRSFNFQFLSVIYWSIAWLITSMNEERLKKFSNH